MNDVRFAQMKLVPFASGLSAALVVLYVLCWLAVFVAPDLAHGWLALSPGAKHACSDPDQVLRLRLLPDSSRAGPVNHGLKALADGLGAHDGSKDESGGFRGEGAHRP